MKKFKTVFLVVLIGLLLNSCAKYKIVEGGHYYIPYKKKKAQIIVHYNDQSKKLEEIETNKESKTIRGKLVPLSEDEETIYQMSLMEETFQKNEKKL